jgi:primosomal protein N' (replication factor Y) (superfamily II helicase)
VLVNLLGHGAFLSCQRCGFVWRCPEGCDLPLRPRGATGSLHCSRCGRTELVPKGCPDCGSDRLGTTGRTVERVRRELEEALRVEVGLWTAGGREREEASVVVGTARCVLEEEWDLVAVPDADSLLLGGTGSVERGFRTLHEAASVSRERLLVQTRSPEGDVLRAVLRGDYEAFAAAELPKRKNLRYPPHAYLAEVVLEGPEETVRRAVESRLRPALGGLVEMLGPAPSPGDGGRTSWRLLLRSRRHVALTRAAALIARLAAEDRGRRHGLDARINMDPEEV